MALSLLYLFQTYYNVFGNGTEPVVYLSINAFIAGMFAVGLATGVVLAVGGLLFIQVRQSLDLMRGWNALPLWLRTQQDPSHFRRDLKTHLFNVAFLSNSYNIYMYS